MKTQEKQKKIEKVVQEFIDGYNKRKTIKRKDRIKDSDTLCNFGVLGLWTTREMVEAFYNSFNVDIKIKKTKLKKEIEKFYEEFDNDVDNLYQEEYQMMIKGKHKTKLKYPESFYDHWKKKMEEFILEKIKNGKNET